MCLLDLGRQRDHSPEHEGPEPTPQLGLDVATDVGPLALRQNQPAKPERRVIGLMDLRNNPLKLDQAEYCIHAHVDRNKNFFDGDQSVDQQRRKRRPGVDNDKLISRVDCRQCGT